LTSGPSTPERTAPSPKLDAGPPPASARGDEPFPADTLPREASYFTLNAAFHPAELMPPTRGPEVNAAGAEALRKRTEPRMEIELSAARMRIILRGLGFVLPADTELRARADRYGGILLLPGLREYRVVPAGATRALLGDGRLDVVPLSTPEVELLGEGPKRFGSKTRKVAVRTRVGKAVFELASAPDLAEGGALLTRFLLDLVGARPSTVLTGDGEFPSRVEYTWSSTGTLSFEVTQLLRRPELPAPIAVPPSEMVFTTRPPGRRALETVLGPADLAQLRAQPVDLPQADPKIPGLRIANGTAETRLVLVDGVLVAVAGPWSQAVLPGLVRGRYQVQLRTFLGDSVTPVPGVIVPGRAEIGVVDAGAPLP
jgi:hypothetical protein